MTIPPRPDRHHADVIAETAAELLHESGLDAHKLAEAAKAVIARYLLETPRHCRPDGYEIMKAIESACAIDGEAKIVAKLDDADAILDAWVRIKTEEWVETNAIRPTFEIGQVVQYGGQDLPIIEINLRLATYSFRTGPYTYRSAVPFENVTRNKLAA